LILERPPPPPSRERFYVIPPRTLTGLSLGVGTLPSAVSQLLFLNWFSLQIPCSGYVSHGLPLTGSPRAHRFSGSNPSGVCCSQLFLLYRVIEAPPTRPGISRVVFSRIWTSLTIFFTLEAVGGIPLPQRLRGSSNPRGSDLLNCGVTVVDREHSLVPLLAVATRPS